MKERDLESRFRLSFDVLFKLITDSQLSDNKFENFRVVESNRK